MEKVSVSKVALSSKRVTSRDMKEIVMVHERRLSNLEKALKKRHQNRPKEWEVEEISFPDHFINVRLSNDNFQKFVDIYSFVIYRTKSKRFIFDSDGGIVFFTNLNESKKEVPVA